MSSWESIILYNKQSSAKSLSDDVIFLEMSLMYSKNIRGPSTVPCGTPDVTITEGEDSPLSKTRCVRSVNHALIQLKMSFLMP